MKKAFVEYNLELKSKSRELRNNSTLSEVLLWQKLRAGNMVGYKFNRQKPIDNYVVDFYCKELNLIIEIDGKSHDYRYKQDVFRQKKLEALGLKFLRFTDLEVKRDMNNVLRAIEIFVDEHKEENNPPSPLFKGESDSI